MLSILKSVKARVEAYQSGDEFEKWRNQSILLILGDIIRLPERWDKLCQANIEFIGHNTIATLSGKLPENNKDSLDDLFTIFFRYMMEYNIHNKEMPTERSFISIQEQTMQRIDNFTTDAKSQILYVIHMMPSSIFKYVLERLGFKNIIEYSEQVKKLDAKVEDIERAIEKKVDEGNTITEKLDSYIKEVGYASLHEGFSRLLGTKKDEKKWNFFVLILLGALVLAPMSYELYRFSFLKDFTFNLSAVISFIPIVSLTAIFIYFFRIELLEYKSLKSQVLQLELRKTFCTFIKDYSKDAAEIKNNSQPSLERFEKVIFTPIAETAEPLPSVYDGICQLADLIKRVKE